MAGKCGLNRFLTVYSNWMDIHAQRQPKRLETIYNAMCILKVICGENYTNDEREYLRHI